MIKKTKLLFLLLVSTMIPVGIANATGRIYPEGVVYQSCVSTSAGVDVVQPNNAVIKVSYNIDGYGKIFVTVTNLTDKIMTINNAMSFFRNSSGESLSYYDSKETKGITTKTIGPRGQIELGKIFETNLGNYVSQYLDQTDDILNNSFTFEDSYLTFGVYITYSEDNGNTWQRIDADFYANTMIACRVTRKLDMNSALEELYRVKPDALLEPWLYIYFKVAEYKKKGTQHVGRYRSSSYYRKHTFVKYQ